MEIPTKEEVKQIIEELDNKLKEEPENAVFWHDRGVAYMHLEKWDKAKENLEHALTLLKGKDALTAHYHLGTIYAEKGKFDKAINEWKKVLEIDERNVFAHYSIAKVYAQKDLLDASLMHLRKADRYNTNRSIKLIHQTMARVLMLKGEYEEAMERWNMVVEIDKEDVDAYHQLAMLNLHINNMDEALEYCKKEISLGSSDASVFYNAGLASLGLNQAEEAITYFQKAMRKGLDDTSLKTNLGEAYARNDQPDEALKMWKQALEQDEKNYHASFNIGIVYFDNKLYERAIEEWERTLKINPDYLPALVTKASAYLNLEKYDKAYKSITKAKQIDPDNDIIRINLSEILLYRDMPEKALEEAQHAAMKNEKSPLGYLLSACAYAQMDNYEQAALALEQSYEINDQIFDLTASLVTKVISKNKLDKLIENVESQEVSNKFSEAIDNYEKIKGDLASNNKEGKRVNKFLKNILK
ncbi:MAG: tetratricopeptide repeat protein [Clostridia bacterium]